MEKTLQKFSITFALLYFVIVIISIIIRDYSQKISTTDLELIGAFLLFILGFICCFDYPLIAGILFVFWSVSWWMFGLDETGNYVLLGLVGFGSFFVLILGLSFIFSWWRTKSMW